MLHPSHQLFFFFTVPGVSGCNRLDVGTWAKVPWISPIALNFSDIDWHSCVSLHLQFLHLFKLVSVP